MPRNLSEADNEFKYFSMYNLLLALYSRLSLRNVQRLGAALGKLAYVLRSRERRIAEANIAACLHHLSKTQQQRLVKETLIENGKLLAELPLAWNKATSFWQEILDENGITQVLNKLKHENKGVIIIAPHLGNWEIGLNAVTPSIEMTVLYRPPRRAALETLMTSGRQATGAKTAPTNASGIKLLLEALNKGEGIGVLPDQTPKKNRNAAALFAPFFGQPAYTMTLIAKLAVKTRAAVITFYAERLPRGKGFRVHFHQLDDAIYSTDTLTSVTAMNQAIERCVLETPTQYQWTYKRFSVQPEGQEYFYS